MIDDEKKHRNVLHASLIVLNSDLLVEVIDNHGVLVHPVVSDDQPPFLG